MSRGRRFALWIGIGGIVILFVIATRLKTAPPRLMVEGPWTGAVKRGAMRQEVRGRAVLIENGRSSKLIARLSLLDKLAQSVEPGQTAEVYLTQTTLIGKVRYIYPNPGNGSRFVDIALNDAPRGARAGEEADAAIHLGELTDVLYVGRPAHADANTTMGVFKLVEDGEEAQRVVVKFGRTSVNTIEVVDGLQEGDQIILSDMSAWDQFDRIRMR